MYKDVRVLGVIPARGGSKGIPGKNIKKLAGKPLIAYTIEAAQKSKYLTRCIVSTDDNQIAEIAKQYNADVPFMRPSELATDTTTSIAVMQHALTWLKEEVGETYDYVMILQPTSPLRTDGDIDTCIQKAVDANADSVMSMVELDDFSIKKLKKIENDRIVPLAEEEGRQSSRRQDMSAVYKRNCAVYLTKTSLMEQGDLFGVSCLAHVMPFDRSVDINQPVDFDLAEFFITRS